MPSPFQQHKQRFNKKALKPGSLAYDLREIKRDIRKAKRGEETEASLEEMKDARRRYKEAIQAAEREERDAALRELNPRQPPSAKEPVTKIETANQFKIKLPTGIAGARG